MPFFSQKKFEYKPDRHFQTKYVLKGSKDTVNTRILNVGTFKASIYSIHTWVNKMMFIDENGKKQVKKENELDYLEIKDNKGVTRAYYSSLKFFDKDLGLVDLLYDGKKIKWFADYYYVNIYGNLGSTEYLVEKDKPTIESGLFSGMKSKLKERFANHQDILQDLENYKTAEDFIEILEKYDSK